MRGLITGKDVLLNLRIVWTEFGAVVTLRCLRALVSREPTTFLDVALKGAATGRARRSRPSRLALLQ